MATFTFFHEFKKFLGDGTIDLDSHTFKAALSNTAPNAASNIDFGDITEITAGNGYTAGGQALSSVTWAETGSGTGIWRFSAASFSWTATGGAIADFRYVIVYDDSAPNDELVGYWDYGSSLSVATGNSFTVNIGSSGIFELS